MTDDGLGRLLEINRMLPGGVKFALENLPRRLVLVAEVPWEEDATPDHAVGEVITGEQSARS